MDGTGAGRPPEDKRNPDEREQYRKLNEALARGDCPLCFGTGEVTVIHPAVQEAICPHCLGDYPYADRGFITDLCRVASKKQEKIEGPEKDWGQAEGLLRLGHHLFGFCEGCGSALAMCDVEGCKGEAYKYVDCEGPVSRMKVCHGREEFYFCERHGDVWRPPWHFDEHGDVRQELDEDPDFIVMYWPGIEKECRRCDFPY